MRSRVHARGWTLRAVVVGLVAVVVSGVVLPVVAVARVEPSVVPGSAPDESTAVRYAELSGESVVVESATTETEELRANPDGTMTLTEHVQPVRVRRGDGWVPVDLSLERKPDGTFGPRASTVDVVFSGGGVGSAGEPLAKIVQNGHEVGLGWESDLPEPVVDGATLTYPNVLPDVDLKLEANLKGFSELLVVKTPEAAAHSDLDRVEFRTHAENVVLEQGLRPDGVLVARDGAGTPVFVGDASQMWDSSGGAEGEAVEVAGPGDRQATMAVEVTADAVAITPDQEFFDDPATTYPVVLDPEYSCTNCGKVHHVVVQEPWPNQKNFDATGGMLGDLKAGWQTASALGAPSNGISRTYLQMNTAPIIGKHIASAYLHVDVINSAECASATPTELWHVGWVDANTTWNNQPGRVGLMDGINRTNNAAHCPGERGADFNAVGTVQAAANQGWAWTTLMLKAAQEGNTSGWRRFDLNPYLVVKYNSYPNPPGDLGVQGWGPNAGDALPCRVGADRAVVGTRTPKLRARFTDPDGGKMDGGFRLYDSNNGFMGEMYVKDIYSGGFGEVTVPVAPVPWITRDAVYRWNVWNGDGQFRSESPNCEFEVDSVKPNTPVVSSTDYPATGVHGVAGRTGLFTFKTNGNTGTGGTMDVRRYGWSINNNTATTNFVDVTSADGTVTLPITPPRAGTNTLHVTAFDRATNRSATNAVYVFQVAEPTGPTGSWAVDETSGTTAVDGGSGNRPLTLAGNASFGSGYAGNALVLNGTGGYASTATPVVDTSRAFTISAWAKPTTAAGHLTVVGQDAPASSPFYLQYTGSAGRWTFTTIGVDNSIGRVAATTPTRAGAWTHLLGVYRPDDGLISLYVDGRPEGTGHAKIRPATGSLVVGASIWNNARTDFFSGSVDKVRVWDRALTPDEAAAEATATGPRAHYQLDERSGTTTRDEVTGQQGTLSGGAAWAGDTSSAAASTRKWLNFGTSGAVTAPRPSDLRTDRSYSVSAWVRLTTTGTDTRAAVSMGDGRFPPFLLLYQAETRRWGFLMTQQPDSSTWWIAQSDTEGELNRWVHLVGTYDSVSGRIALYVDGAKQTVNFSNTPDGGGVTGWNGTGPLSIGRGRWEGQAANPWQGDVDDVRVHSGVLTPAQVLQLHSDTLHY